MSDIDEPVVPSTPDDYPDDDHESVDAFGFADLGLKPDLLRVLDELGYEQPSPIQLEAIPELMARRDVIGQAATGTGKTAAFALPILQSIGRNEAAIPLALIVTPTRELAMQVAEACETYGREIGVRVTAVFGGQPAHIQLRSLRKGAHVVVATPGRAVDLIERGGLDLDAIQTVVLDEADEMLDMGFADDLEAILDATPENRQTVLFSATMPPRIAQIAEKYQRDPVTVRVEQSASEKADPSIRQTVYFAMRAHKAATLGRVLDVERPRSTIVFCRTRTDVDELTVTMGARGYRAEALHGGMDQRQRDRVMARLRDGTAEILIATDVAARGLDVDSLTHVVNFDVPTAPESYVHRIGRVGRAGRAGVAITIAEPRQRRLLGEIERVTGHTLDVQKIPTVADLRAIQSSATTQSVAEAITTESQASDGANDLVDSMLSTLRADHNDEQIARAALTLLHEARGAQIDEREIPDASDWKKKQRRNDRERGRNDRGRDRLDRGKGGKGDKGRDKKRNQRPHDLDRGFLHVSLGRKVGVRPGDLVGAIANEGGISGSEIGPIRIHDNYAVVGVPETSVDDIVQSMQRTSIRGKRARVRRFHED